MKKRILAVIIGGFLIVIMFQNCGPRVAKTTLSSEISPLKNSPHPDVDTSTEDIDELINDSENAESD